MDICDPQPRCPTHTVDQFARLSHAQVRCWGHNPTYPALAHAFTFTGERYAEDVQRVIEDIRRQDRKLACFIAETVLSCGGQIVPPEGYLQAVYGYYYRSLRSALWY